MNLFVPMIVLVFVIEVDGGNNFWRQMELYLNHFAVILAYPGNYLYPKFGGSAIKE